MKATLLYISLFLISFGSLAQPNKDRIKALKVAHITNQLDLTETEAQQFWPIYNAFDANISKIRREIRAIHRTVRQNFGSQTDQEADALLKRFIDAESRIHLERSQLVEKLRNVIPSRKIIRLKVAEEDFNRRILEEMKKRRGQRLNKNKP